jgi:hypothetical protein
VIIVLLVENAVPFSFLLMAYAATYASAAAPFASAAAPLTQVWWTGWAGGLVLGIALWVRIFLSVFAV